jgi:hypothetical protein
MSRLAAGGSFDRQVKGITYIHLTLFVVMLRSGQGGNLHTRLSGGEAEAVKELCLQKAKEASCLHGAGRTLLQSRGPASYWAPTPSLTCPQHWPGHIAHVLGQLGGAPVKLCEGWRIAVKVQPGSEASKGRPGAGISAVQLREPAHSCIWYLSARPKSFVPGRVDLPWLPIVCGQEQGHW